MELILQILLLHLRTEQREKGNDHWNSKSDPTFEPDNFSRAIAFKSVGSGILHWHIILNLDVPRYCSLPS